MVCGATQSRVKSSRRALVHEGGGWFLGSASGGCLSHPHCSRRVSRARAGGAQLQHGGSCPQRGNGLSSPEITSAADVSNVILKIASCFFSYRYSVQLLGSKCTSPMCQTSPMSIVFSVRLPCTCMERRDKFATLDTLWSDRVGANLVETNVDHLFVGHGWWPQGSLAGAMDVGGLDLDDDDDFVTASSGREHAAPAARLWDGPSHSEPALPHSRAMVTASVPRFSATADAPVRSQTACSVNE